MKIVRITGGLGNQMYQYIFYRFLDAYSSDKCVIDDGWFLNNHHHNGMELYRLFDINPRRLCDEFTEPEWLELSKSLGTHSFFEAARSLGIDINIMTEYSYHDRLNKLYHLAEHPRGRDSIWEIPYPSTGPDVSRVLQLQGHFYFNGTWANRRFFDCVRDKILRELSFPPFDDDANKSLAAHIESTNSVGVHVRRGDFVRINWHTHPNSYAEPVRIMKRAIIKPTFFIFSDEPAWCRDNLSEMSLSASDDVVIVDINNGSSNFRDMQLMILCKHMICAHYSTFSQMAAMLNRNPDKIIAHPGV